MSLENLTELFLPEIEAELQLVVAQTRLPGLEDMHSMLAYHMGWEGEDAGPVARGKRIRPLLVLLTASASGGEWQCALPAAAAVELVHNFSLIHDDIQDQSPHRHKRLTVWKIWGIAQAINAGDAMFTLAFLALQRLADTVSTEAALHASRILQEACLSLTQGQYLDMSYETRSAYMPPAYMPPAYMPQDLTEDAYWPMVNGKTAALLSACLGLGALVGKASPAEFVAYRDFGRLLGLAFQVLDDYLGIWGDAALTGKSTESDLMGGKKSLPVLYGLGRNGPFARRWAEGPITAAEVEGLSAELAAEGARDYTLQRADELTAQALQALQRADPKGDSGQALAELAHKLLKRVA